MNDPRCDAGRPRCLNQAAGHWRLNDGERIALCDDDRREFIDQGIRFNGNAWEPLIPDPVQAATSDCLQRMASGYFG